MKYLLQEYKIFLLCVILLIPTLFFPISSDLSAFMQGGMSLVNGGELYKDFYDVKPPFVYYIFSIFYSIFGNNIFLYRLFDLLYQLAFLASAYYIFRSFNLNKIVFYIFAVTFALFYTSMNFTNVLQVESLAFLPMIWYFYYSLRTYNSFRNLIIKGILLSIIVSLKYTLGIILIAEFVFYLMLKKDFKSIVLQSFIQFSILILFLFLIFLPTIITNNLSGFWGIQEYAASYSSHPPLSIEFIKYSLKIISSNMTNTLSLSLIAMVAVAYYEYVKNNKDDKLRNAVVYGFLLMIFLFISLLIEKKYFNYHFLRIAPFFLFIASLGAYRAYKELNFKKLPTYLFLILFLGFSPITKYLKEVQIPFLYIKDQNSYLNYFKEGNDQSVILKAKNLADYINVNYPNKKFLLVNSEGNEAIHYLEKDYEFAFPQSAFYLTKISNEKLQNKFFTELQRADVVAIQNDDISWVIMLEEKSSYDLFLENDKFNDYLSEKFEKDTIINDSYIVYKRIK